MIGPKKSSAHLEAESAHPEMIKERLSLESKYAGFFGYLTEKARNSVKSREELLAIREEIEAFNARWVEAGFDRKFGLAAPDMEEIDRLFPVDEKKDEENFTSISEEQSSWIKSNSKRWAKDGRIRYYINLNSALSLANAVDEEKKGSPVAIIGLSKTKSSAQMQSWAVYFDAVSGKICQNGTRDEVYNAFLKAFEGIHG